MSPFGFGSLKDFKKPAWGIVIAAMLAALAFTYRMVFR